MTTLPTPIAADELPELPKPDREDADRVRWWSSVSMLAFRAEGIRIALEADRAARHAAVPMGMWQAVEPAPKESELLKAAHNACNHFYEFNETPEALAASEFGRSMDMLEEAVGRVRDAALQSLVDDAQAMGLYDAPATQEGGQAKGVGDA